MAKIDPLQSWAQLSRAPHAVSEETETVRAMVRKLSRYLSVHEKRAERPVFAEDLLRQQDCRALGVQEVPSDVVLSQDVRQQIRSLLDEVYSRSEPVDEPWIERQLLHVLGYARHDDDVSWWDQLLWRNGDGDAFAEERRRYALAALAWRAALVPEGSADDALVKALSHGRASVRSSAMLYVMASHRLMHRGLSMKCASALHHIASRDPALEPRAIARIVLELDRIECVWDHPHGIYEFALFSAENRKSLIAEVSLKTVQTAAHLHALICAHRRWSVEQYTLSLMAMVRGDRFDLCRTDKMGRAPEQLQLGSIGIREGEQLLHRSPEGETVVVLRRVIPWVDSKVRVAWGAHTAPICLLESPVNGTRFHRAKQALEYLRPSDLLVLQRESGNAHDDRAVEVLTVRGDKLGYIPRGQNRVIAALMDEGEWVSARVLEIDGEAEFPVIFLRVHSDPAQTLAPERVA